MRGGYSGPWPKRELGSFVVPEKRREISVRKGEKEVMLGKGEGGGRRDEE